MNNMNRCQAEILLYLNDNPFPGQRMLSHTLGMSLGKVNKELSELINDGLINSDFMLSASAHQILRRPQRAVILAAGRGLRMIPINSEVPKALLEVKGEILIERTIRQLHEVGINEIHVIAGFLKEQFEYLIDEYGVDLIINGSYSESNTLHSLSLASKYLDDCYVIPSDIWCACNPFRRNELLSWYMVTDHMETRSDVRLGRMDDLIRVGKGEEGNAMTGIAYLTGAVSRDVVNCLMEYDRKAEFRDSFWEEVLYRGNRMCVSGRKISREAVFEINTYDDLRELDSSSRMLRSDAIDVISRVLNIPSTDITDIEILKKGMTNRSFLFNARGRKYIMRIPGEGTDKLIDRYGEAEAYSAISGKGLCDDPVYIDPATGYKITEYLEGVRPADPFLPDDVTLCMNRLRAFHEMKLTVSKTFDIFAMIDFYESLWEMRPSVYRDYEKTKAGVLSLRPYIDSHEGEKWLTHIDAVPDNFLFADKDGKQELQLTDWEYAAMQDPHVDIAMFCIYSLYDRKHIDGAIDMYFMGSCDDATRIKIYCYVAACGLLWSNWCEYKHFMGVEFGEYSIAQYRYAKEYCRLALTEMEKKGYESR